MGLGSFVSCGLLSPKLKHCSHIQIPILFLYNFSTSPHSCLALEACSAHLVRLHGSAADGSICISFWFNFAFVLPDSATVILGMLCADL